MSRLPFYLSLFFTLFLMGCQWPQLQKKEPSKPVAITPIILPNQPLYIVIDNDNAKNDHYHYAIMKPIFERVLAERGYKGEIIFQKTPVDLPENVVRIDVVEIKWIGGDCRIYATLSGNDQMVDFGPFTKPIWGIYIDENRPFVEAAEATLNTFQINAC
jgi:hypothetical protein